MIGQPLRKSVPTATVEAWWTVGWAYVMPDFNAPDHSLIEWLSDKPAREPTNPHADQLATDVVREMGRVRR